jgi:hypothetical protein
VRLHRNVIPGRRVALRLTCAAARSATASCFRLLLPHQEHGHQVIVRELPGLALQAALAPLRVAQFLRDAPPVPAGAVLLGLEAGDALTHRDQAWVAGLHQSRQLLGGCSGGRGGKAKRVARGAGPVAAAGGSCAGMRPSSLMITIIRGTFTQADLRRKR